MRLVAVGSSGVADNRGWSEGHGFRFEVWSDPDGDIIDGYGVRSEWDTAPMRDAFILDATGRALVHHEGAVSMGASPSDVLEDCRTLFGATDEADDAR